MSFSPDMTIGMLFWNLQGKALDHNLVRLVQQHNINIVLLAESPYWDNPRNLLDPLREYPRFPGEKHFEEINPKAEGQQRVHLFSNLDAAAWNLRVVRNRYTIWAVTAPNGVSFFLAAVHFPSIQEDQGDEQRESIIALRHDLEAVEADSFAPRSILMGDFNANPFDAGIYGLNATRLQRVAEGEPRELNGRNYAWFYNPMWRFLGTDTPGTYYKRLSKPVCYDWFLLDQVLVRPAVLSFFDKEADQDLAILISDGDEPLITASARLPRANFPDHLPVLFRVHLPGE